MSKLTLQEMFDRTVDHMRRQGRRAMSVYGSACAFRSPDGAKCAVGYWIPEGHAAEQATGGLGSLTVEYGAATRSWLRPSDRGSYMPDFWRSMQSAHDDYDNWDDNGFNAVGEARLQRIARAHELTYSPPTEQQQAMGGFNAAWARVEKLDRQERVLTATFAANGGIG